MPPLERTDLKDVCVVWPLIRRAGYGGDASQQPYDGYNEPVVGAPFQINCRWVEKQTKMQDREGNEITLDVQLILDEDWTVVPVDSVVWHGAILDLLGTGSFSAPDSTTYQIKAFARTGDIKNRHQRRKAGLMRFRDSLPTVSAVQPSPLDE